MIYHRKYGPMVVGLPAASALLREVDALKAGGMVGDALEDAVVRIAFSRLALLEHREPVAFADPRETLLKVTDVAERLGVNKSWVYARINRGEIPVVELGDTRKNQRIRESDLDSFIAARTYGVGRQ
ncbi:helix-turn-helix transcriptional regulator [Microbacterium sp. A93]|uniref:helix-turn-helix transcriptional regulator n=1 Tax=Microbacterium sp. A93 TaxID=3450716 RepID=UPI003F4254B4